MSWIKQDVIPAGQYLYINVTGGFYVDLLGNLTPEAVADQVRALAQGWTVIEVKWQKGFLGIGDKLVIYGRATRSLITSAVRFEVANAVNAFWQIAGADAEVYISDNLATPPPSEAGDWTGTVQMVAVAVIVVAVVWGISETRKILK